MSRCRSCQQSLCNGSHFDRSILNQPIQDRSLGLCCRVKFNNALLLGQRRNHYRQMLDNFTLEIQDVGASSTGSEVILGWLLVQLPGKELRQDCLPLGPNDKEVGRANDLFLPLLDAISDIAPASR